MIDRFVKMMKKPGGIIGGGREIDFSDIPELYDRQLSSMHRVGQPALGDEPKKLIATRLDREVLRWLRKTAEKKGLPYQSRVNEILASEMRKAS